MADEHHEVRRIDWGEVFGFTHVFKSFRMAIHFSKLALALAAVVLIWVWGGVMDEVTSWGGAYVPHGEIAAYAARSPEAFDEWQKQAARERDNGIDDLWQQAHEQKQSLTAFLTILAGEDGTGGHFEEAFKEALRDENADTAATSQLPEADDRAELIDEDPLEAMDKAEELHEAEVARIERLIEVADDEDNPKSAWKKLAADATLDTTEKKNQAEEELEKDLDSARRAMTLRRIQVSDRLERLRGETVFASFLDYEGQCLQNALLAVRYANFTGGLDNYRQAMQNRARLLPAPPASHGLGGASPAPADNPPGLLFWALMAAHGFCWMLGEHWLFALIFLAVALAIWALFGGAVHRIAALHFARDEKISIGQSLKFAAGKFLSFYFAPLIPMAIILVIGILLLVGGLLLGTWLGGILMGLLFPLAIAAGLLIAFLAIGLAGGWALMYPTIAVESSDSFDAISRSYSYIFGRPWRALLYAGAAVVHGTICYLFVRLFAFLALAATRTFVAVGVIGGGDTVSSEADKLDVLWPAPVFENLNPAPRIEAMGGFEPVGAWLIQLWLCIVAAAVLAFLWSYCSSAATAIYYLLRRQVDATDLDDVYVEEPEEEVFGAEPPAEPAAEATPEPERPAEPEGPAEKSDEKPEAEDDKGEGKGEGESEDKSD